MARNRLHITVFRGYQRGSPGFTSWATLSYIEGRATYLN